MATGAVATRAIVLTDMVDSTALRSRLGDRRADALRRAHDELMAAAVDEHQGVVLRSTGDGIKASFAAASAAIAAAIGIQRAVAAYGRRHDAVAPFEVRIGIAVGEVVHDDGDDHGVAVIEAARLEALAEPGEILATELVARLGSRRARATFETVGRRELKGLDEPVDVVRVVDDGDDPAALPLPRALSADRRFPLVGRAAVIDSIETRWEAACTGRAGMVLVSGQPGLGKSRVVAHVAESVHARGAIVLAGTCDGELPVPYLPIATALGGAATLDAELALAVEARSGPLGPLFPGRRADRHEVLGPVARAELFASTADAVRRLAAARPVLLIVEDVHWADPSTLLLLRALLRQSDGTRLLVVATARTDDIDPETDASRASLLAELALDPGVSRLELSPLTDDDVAALIATRIASGPDRAAAFAGALRHESAGNAFFTCELLDHLATTGQLERLVRDGGRMDGLPVPESVRDVVGQRLARLPAACHEVLTTASVVGLAFDVDVVAGACEMPAGDVLAQVELAQRAAVLSELDAGRFTFTHAIVRSTLLDGLSATRRALTHRRVAETLEAAGGRRHDELVHHWTLARDDDRAHRHLAAAAERDLRALSFESAVGAYERVLAHARAAEQPDLGVQARAWLGLGLARRALGDPTYIDAVDQAGRLARRLRDPDLMAEAAAASLWPGTFFLTAHRTETALVELCEDALDVLAADDPRRVRILATLAAHLAFDDDRTRRGALLSEAHDLARSLADPELVGSALCAEYIALWDPTTLDRRAEIATQIARQARASGDVDLAFLGAFFQALCSAERCDLAAARRHLATSIAPADESRNFYYEFLRERLAISLDIFTGTDDAQAAVDALAGRYAGTHADTSGTWAIQTAMISVQHAGLGPLADAMRGMSEHSGLAPNWVPAYGLALLANGDRDGATEIAERYVPPAVDYLWLSTMQSYGDLVAELGLGDRCRTVFELLLPFRGQLGVVSSGSAVYALVARTLGRLALALGDRERAVELLTEALTTAESMGAPHEAAECRRLLAWETATLERPG